MKQSVLALIAANAISACAYAVPITFTLRAGTYAFAFGRACPTKGSLPLALNIPAKLLLLGQWD
jgi:hypothetical protein